MIKPWIAAAGLSVLAATALQAAEPVTPTDRRNVLSFGVASSSESIEYRRMFLDSRLAVIATGGYHNQTQTETTDQGAVIQHSSFRFMQLGLGLRRTFNTADQLRPFAQVDVLRESSGFSNSCRIPAGYGYDAVGGGEYFVGRRVSFEASAGLSYGRGGSGCFGGSLTGTASVKSFGTFRSAVSLNFYF